MIDDFGFTWRMFISPIMKNKKVISCRLAFKKAKSGIIAVNLKVNILAWILEGGKVYDK